LWSLNIWEMANNRGVLKDNRQVLFK